MRQRLSPKRFELAAAPEFVPAPSQMRGAAILGLVAMLIAVGGFGVWAATAPLASAVIAAGKVVVATKRKLIQHLEGGIVRLIRVKDGDVVNAGDVLLELDVTKSKGRFAMTRGAYLAALAAEARLSAERDERGAIDFAPDLLKEARADPEIAAVVASQKQLFTARRTEAQGQTDILVQRKSRLDEEIKGFTAERTAAEDQFKLASSELATLEFLYGKGYTTRQRVLAIKREMSQLQGQLGRLSAQIARGHKEIGETELNLLQIRKKISTEVLAELREIQSKVLESREQFQASRNDLERTVVRTPVSGTVVGSQLHTVGGVVRPGETLLEIVPDRDQLIVEVKLRPQDVDDVAIGQPTEVRISAFKQRLGPPFRGRVSHVSADSLADPRTPETFYVAHIEVEATELADPLGRRIQPGMPAEVMIETGKRTALAYLMQPLNDSMNRAWREQ